MTRPETGRNSGNSPSTGVYVYGILPGDTEMRSDVHGVGDPPGQVRLVRYRDLAALVSDVDMAQPLGRPDDLRAHAGLLDAIAPEIPVLPLRFGAVVPDEDAVVHELLGENHDEFAAMLRQLEGHVQFVIAGRYVEQAILREVLSENPEASRLNRQTRDADPVVTRQARMALGEMISDAVTAKRAEDTRVLGHVLSGLVAASVVREPTHELDAVQVAVLVAADAEDDMRQAVGELARDWEGRIQLRLVGPMAAYDFAGSP